MASDPARSDVSPLAGPTASDAAARDGQSLMAEAAQRAFALSGLEARLRVTINYQGRQLPAAGTYAQLGAGHERLVRLDLKMPIGGKVGSVQELRGRDHLWIVRDLPPEPLKLQRIDLHYARKAIARREDTGTLAPLEGWILLGGLSRLLANLDRHFQFGPPRREKLGEISVLVLRGQWKQPSLAALTEAQGDAPLPDQLPEAVEVALGDLSETLPLFPFRVTYLRRPGEAGQGRGVKAPLAPMAAIEFFQVRATTALDPAVFEYDPEDREFSDVTLAYLRRLGLVSPNK